VEDRTRTGVRHVFALDAVPESVPRTRRELAQILADSIFADRAAEAQLAASELVTNAVLHGRQPLHMRVLLTDVCLRVEVVDGSPISPSFSMLDPTALTGRGLMLISAAVDRWGVEPLDTGKAVWFELHSDGGPADEEDVDALLAAWGDDLAEDPALEHVRVVLTDLDTRRMAQAEAHVEGVLRELCLLLSADDVPAEAGRVARSVLQAAAGMEAVRADLKHQLAVAVSAGQPQVDLSLTLQRHDATLVRDYALAIDEADRLSRAGQLLSCPTPADLSELRRSYLRRVIAQLAS
jgi:anti-sigma regulatory factor (Ser/Thr protein kinase)